MAHIKLNDDDKLVTIDGEDYVAKIIQQKKPTVTSALQNDASYTTTDGVAGSADTVDSSVTITSASGTPAGGFGPANNVTINRTTGSIIVPQITIDSTGRITYVVNRTFTLQTP